jgi:hypothetical protein
MLKAAYCEEKMYREVEKVEEGSQEREVRVKILPNVVVSRNRELT